MIVLTLKKRSMMKNYLFALLLLSLTASAQEKKIDGDTAQVVTPVIPVIEPDYPMPAIDSDALRAEAFKLLEDDAEAKLAMTFDTVIYVNGDDTYIRGGNCGQAILLRKTGIPFETGQILFGCIAGRKSMEGHIPVFIGTEKTSTDGYKVLEVLSLQGIERKMAFERDMNGKEETPPLDQYVSDLVVVDTVQITEVLDSEALNCRARCLSMGDTELELIDKFGICPNNVKVGQCYSHVTGILGLGESNYQLYVLSDFNQNIVSSVQSLKAGATQPTPTFDLQGRRLTQKPKKGVYIQEGKKRVVK